MLAILLLLQIAAPTIERVTPFTTQRLQAVSLAGPAIVWVSGTGGTWGLTTDGGTTWKHGVVPGGDSLEFRDVHGFDARQALLLAAGPGDKSRIYRTDDSGKTWTRRFVNTEPTAFYDCFAFWDATSGFAVSDIVRGRLPILVTRDGGREWRLLDSLPAALPGEGAFAASGTCVATWGDSTGAIATGAGPQARVLRTTNRWGTWRASVTPMVQGTPSSGHTSIVLQDAANAMAAGGEIADTLSSAANRFIITRNGGVSWEYGGTVTFPGPIFGVGQNATRHVVAVGPRGASWSGDGGRSWAPLDSLSYWSVDVGPGVAWLVGPAGRIARLRLPGSP